MDDIEKYIAEHSKLKQKTKIAPSQYLCLDCQDTGWIIIDDGGHGTMKRCKCYATKQAEKLMKKSGISAEFRKKGFENFDTGNYPILKKAKTEAIRYVKNFLSIEHERYNSIIFCGQPGSGKTHLGIAICSSLMNMGIAVVYMPYRNVITKIKQNIVDEEKYSRELTIYMNARVLYIDDLLKGRLTEADVNIMYEIVNYRYMNNLPMVISTERFLDGIMEFDEAIGSRIIEMCRKNITQFKEKELNYRLY